MTRRFLRADSGDKLRCPYCDSTRFRPRKLLPVVECQNCRALVMKRELVTARKPQPQPKRAGSGQISGRTYHRGNRWFL